MPKFFIRLFLFFLLSFNFDLIKTFDLPAEIRIGESIDQHSNEQNDNSIWFLGAIFDTGDHLSRRAFEYAVARINAQSKIFPKSKIIVNKIDLVNAHDSFSAYKLGKLKKSSKKFLVSNLFVVVVVSISLCSTGTRCCSDFYGSFDTSIRICQFIDTTIAHSLVSFVTGSSNESRLLYSQCLSTLHSNESSIQ